MDSAVLIPQAHQDDPYDKPPLKVLVIPPSYFDQNRTVGGGERYALEYARALSELTPTTLALFSHERSRAADAPPLKRFQVRHLRHSSLFPATLATMRELAKYEVIHAMIFPSPLTDLVLLQSLLSHTHVVLTDIGGGIPCASTRLAKLNRRFDINRRASGLAHLSRYASTPYADWNIPQTVLYGGIHDGLRDAESAEPTGYALFVGRLLPHKGVLELISAISPDIPLRVVGRPYDEEYFAKLKTAAEGKQVSFFTSADDAELNAHYRDASVVIQPSIPSEGSGFDRSELLGLVAIEGMSWGKPVIVTDTASLPELMIDGSTGRIVPAGDPTALNNAITEFVTSPALSREIGAQARHHAISSFTWSAAAHRGISFYRSLISN